MVPFEKHVFVCTSGSHCPVDGTALEIHARLKTLVKDAGLKVSIRINNSGCLDQCGHGPMIVVYPENVWYGNLGLQDVDTIFSEHLVEGRPVERLRYLPARPGPNKIARPPLADAAAC